MNGVGMKKSIISVILFFSFVVSLPAFSDLPVIDLTNYVVNQNTALKTGLTYLEEEKSLEQQIMMTKNQLKNLLKLPSFTWDNAYHALNKLDQEIKQGNALAYSVGNTDSAFKKLYPDYNNINQNNYQDQFKKLTKTNQDTMRGILNQLHTSMEQEKQESQTIDKLSSDARKAKGHMQSLQLANEIATEQIAILQKMHQTIMAQTNAQVEYYAMKTQKESMVNAKMHEIIKNSQEPYPKYKENSHFGLIPKFTGGM